jgi:15-cis-phytoene synthase
VKPESAAHAAQLLRDQDRDRYFSTLILPEPQRTAITALYAFNAEAASVPDRAREPAAGEIRLRWWTDAIMGAGHGESRANPVADALLSTIEDYRLPLAAFERLLEARRFDLYQDPMPKMATFEGYAGDTASALYQIAAMILNGGRPVEPGDAAGHLGVAHALVGHLRAFGFNASRGRIFLPWDVFATCGVKEAELFAGTTSEGLAVALTRLAEIARQHLEKAALAVGALPKTLRPAFAPIAILGPELRRLDFESPFQRPRDLADWQKIARLSWWRLHNL